MVGSMYSLDPLEGRGPVIAVVGGGASGTLAVIHLLRSAAASRCPLRVVLIDRHGRHGLGQAYSRAHPAHLLNTAAGQMSALAGDPGHLMRWADAAGITHDGFLARHAYGRYPRETLSDAERSAQPTARVSHLTSHVVAVRRNAQGPALRLRLADGCIDADAAVLAIGNLPAAPPCPVPQSPRYIADPWAPGALDGAGDGSPVIVLGTGLTMLDVAIAVTDGHRATRVHAVSRHGLLPRVHRGQPAAARTGWLPATTAGAAGPVGLTDLMWQVRAAVADRPDSWPDVIDGLRPHVPGLWQRLPIRDKRLFLRHVARYWEVHRHRMPPATARRITELRCTGRLSVLQGRITAVAGDRAGLRARIDPAGPAAARDRRRLQRRGARRGRPVQQHHFHARPAPAGALVRDDRHPGDPGPGRCAGPPPDCRPPGTPPPGQRRVAPTLTGPLGRVQAGRAGHWPLPGRLPRRARRSQPRPRAGWSAAAVAQSAGPRRAGAPGRPRPLIRAGAAA